MKKKKAAKAESLQDVLFEIGCEELPATNLADIFESAAGQDNALAEKLKRVFEDKRIAFKGCQVWATPRRLVFWVGEVAPAQSPKVNLSRILPKEEAFDAAGKPTEKLLTILKHRQASPADVTMGEQNGREYAFLKKAEPAEKTVKILPELFETLVKSLGFPKNMRWDDSGLMFPRPIRNCFALYGQTALGCRMHGVKAKAETVIFQRGSRKRHVVKDIPSYFRLLQKHGVILDQVERKKKIKHILEKLAQGVGGRLYDDPFLLNEVNFLVESPDGLWAPFGEEFLKLPLEVLTVSMARKQRIFGMIGKDGKVMPRFLAILDGAVNEKLKKGISKNIENILHAKLQDSLFFYREDVKATLEKKRAELSTLVFLKGAGSMLEKSERLTKLASKASEWLDLSPDDRHALGRAAYLAKSDLLSQMVGEFPELQGVIGHYYALENGEPSSVARAIGEQYLPRTVSDRIPETPAGALLSALDKIDLITACFGLGLEPSSSLDPYGLRRSATAVLKIVIDKKLALPLGKLLAESRALLGTYAKKDREAQLGQKLDAFFRDRFKALLVERGYREDVVDAALGAGFDRPYETVERVQALETLAADERFSEARKVVERTVNILKGSKDQLPDRVDPGLFAEDLEHEVFKSYQASEEGIRRAISARDFRGATRLYAEAFFAILERFFEKVFVNAEDPNVRKNRLALLREVRDLYTREIADLSKIRVAASTKI